MLGGVQKRVSEHAETAMAISMNQNMHRLLVMREASNVSRAQPETFCCELSPVLWKVIKWVCGQGFGGPRVLQATMKVREYLKVDECIPKLILRLLPLARVCGSNQSLGWPAQMFTQTSQVVRNLTQMG